MGGLYEALGGGSEPEPWDRRTSLTTEQVSEVRRLYREARGVQTEIAEHFGVSQACVSRIVNYKRRAQK